MAQKSELYVGLDIGTSKVCAVVGEMDDAGDMQIVGVGYHPSKGLRKGVIINIEATVDSIHRAVQEAEIMAGCKITHVYTGIAGGHIKGFNSHGIVAVKDKEVSEIDLARVMDAAKAVAIPMDREILHVLPQEYIVDQQDGIREPRGMSGVRLEAKVHIVTGAVTSAQNIIKCAQRCGLTVVDMVLEQLASSYCVLSQDEKDLGVALIDIGGGTTDICLFSEGHIVHTSVLAIGGDHITGDIAVGLRTPTEDAERLKQRHGCASLSLLQEEGIVEVPSVGGRAPKQVSRYAVTEIIEPRVEEIFYLVKDHMHRTGYVDLLASGVVLTGGSTLMPGMAQVAEQILDLPVRCGAPQGVSGLVEIVQSPIYATGVGLVLYGLAHESHRFSRGREKNVYYQVKNRMRSWLGDFF